MADWFKKIFNSTELNHSARSGMMNAAMPTPAPTPAPAPTTIAAQSSANYQISSTYKNMVTITPPNTNFGTYYTTGNITSNYPGAGITSAHVTPQYNFTAAQPVSIITFYDSTQSEIVRLDKDGKVTWKNGIDVDLAAQAFAKSISLGAEMQAGISKSVKLSMRDSVFNDLIEIAKEKGPLSADDLTYLLEASKIVEKLKGGKE